MRSAVNAAHDIGNILGFLAFIAIWLFPILFGVAILGFSRADRDSQKPDPGPNVVPFPARPKDAPPPATFTEKIRRLAKRAANR